jgi:hypothetical protein
VRTWGGGWYQGRYKAEAVKVLQTL